MPTTVDHLISTCFDELKAIEHYQSYAQKATDEGYPQINKFFRVEAVSETARKKIPQGYGAPYL